MTANSSDRPSQPPDKEWNLVAGETKSNYGDFHAQAPIKGLTARLEVKKVVLMPEIHPGSLDQFNEHLARLLQEGFYFVLYLFKLNKILFLLENIKTMKGQFSIRI